MSKVQEGEKRPSRVAQKSKYTKTVIHSISRGDRSGTAWESNKNKNQNFGDVQTLDDSPEVE